jgi:hypothetical protein
MICCVFWLPIYLKLLLFDKPFLWHWWFLIKSFFKGKVLDSRLLYVRGCCG